jgi:transcriptional regulator with XRE-family HTH domain
MPKAPNSTDKHVGNRVRSRRLVLGMSQTDLARSAGITFQQIQKYENGANRISSSRLQQFADALHIAVTYFFEGQVTLPKRGSVDYPQMKETRNIQDFLATKDGVALVKAYQQISNRELRLSIVRLVERLSGEE